MGILIPLIIILVSCLFIWRACDGFEVASEYIGRNMSEGVRGGTINAISSSIPELFTTLIALFLLSDKDGFAVGIGTTAGSALFNGMIIPAACILSVVGFVVAGVKVASVNVSTKVLLRDGLALIFCEAVLVLLINGNQLQWWQGLVLMLLYFAYLSYMLLSMTPVEKDKDKDDGDGDGDGDGDAETDEEPAASTVMSKVFYWMSGGPAMDLEGLFIGDKQREEIRNESWNGWYLLAASTTVIGLACYLLVVGCEWLGTGSALHPTYTVFGFELSGIGMPPMFVAVIFASMATSVPDTVISIRDARDGDYDDAVANALGSNIFDICFALGFPLFLFTLIHGPIKMSSEVAAQSGELRLLLLGTTVIGFLVYYVGKRGESKNGSAYVEMKKGKAYLLLLIYTLFVVYIVGLSQNVAIAIDLSNALRSVLEYLPHLG